MDAPSFVIRTGDKTFRDLTDDDKKYLYAGAYFDIKVSAFAYDKGKGGVTLVLIGGCFAGHGEPIQTRDTISHSDFDSAPIIEEDNEQFNVQDQTLEDTDEDLPF